MNKNKSRSSGVSSEQEMRTEFELFALWKLRLHVLGTNNHVYIGQKHKKSETIIIFVLAVNGR